MCLRCSLLLFRPVAPAGAGDRFFAFTTPCTIVSLAEGETSGDCRVPAGTYDVSEADPGSNFAPGASRGGDTDSTVDVASRTAHVAVSPGETVTCTFTNDDQRGHILVHKLVAPAGAGDRFFAFTTPCTIVSLAEGETSGDCRVPAGTYDVSEADPGSNF